MRNSKMVLGIGMSLCAYPSVAQSSFVPLGDISGGLFASGAAAVSGDGLVVAGFCTDGFGQTASRWTASTGWVSIGDLSGGPVNAIALALSFDGSVLAGQGTSAAGTEGFRHEVGIEGLSDLAGGNFYSSANDISHDGATVIGGGWQTLGPEAFKWTLPTGLVGLGDLSGGIFSSAADGCSGDGTVVVGYGHDAIGQQAVRWTTAGVEPLGDLPGGSVYSRAWDVSTSGDVVVGYANYNGDLDTAQAFRWTLATGMVGLGDLAGGSFYSDAHAVSGDGSMVGGIARTANGTEAFIWHDGIGMVNLRDYLITKGVTGLQGWSLTSCESISDDGTVVVGVGTNPNGQTEAWMATLEPLRSISGTILFRGLDLFGNLPTEATFEIRSQDNSTVLGTATTAVNPEGGFLFLSPVPPGNYLVSLKHSHWLRRNVAVNTESANQYGLIFDLANGDVDEDNEVSIGDYAILSMSYNSAPGDPSWVDNADLNEDDSIDIADYAQLSLNYGMTGDE